MNTSTLAISKNGTGNGTVKVKQVVSQVTGLTPGNHTITVVVSGQKNPGSTGYYIDIDAFEVAP